MCSSLSAVPNNWYTREPLNNRKILQRFPSLSDVISAAYKMNRTNILIVDDEPAIRAMVSTALSLANFAVVEAESGSEAFELIYQNKPDLILLDWMLPGNSGIEVLRRLQRDRFTTMIPVIMLTAKTMEEDLVLGLKVGADDYITKPFSPKELLARIEAVLRRSGAAADDIIRCGDLTLNQQEHRFYIGDRPLALGPTEFKLLAFFMRHPNRAYSRAQLLDNVWSGDTYIDERTVDVHIRRLRKVLEEQSVSSGNTEGSLDQLIETVRGMGYRFSSKQKGDAAE